MIKVVGTIFINNNRLLIVKPRKRATFQMVGGGVEIGEEPFNAAIREIQEELNSENVVIDPLKLKLVMEFEEIATSDANKKIYFYVYQYNGFIQNDFQISEEIESFLWYDTTMQDIPLSNTLNHKVIPYCKTKKLIK